MCRSSRYRGSHTTHGRQETPPCPRYRGTRARNPPNDPACSRCPAARRRRRLSRARRWTAGSRSCGAGCGRRRSTPASSRRSTTSTTSPTTSIAASAATTGSWSPTTRIPSSAPTSTTAARGGGASPTASPIPTGSGTTSSSRCGRCVRRAAGSASSLTTSPARRGRSWRRHCPMPSLSMRVSRRCECGWSSPPRSRRSPATARRLPTSAARRQSRPSPNMRPSTRSRCTRPARWCARSRAATRTWSFRTRGRGFSRVPTPMGPTTR